MWEGEGSKAGCAPRPGWQLERAGRCPISWETWAQLGAKVRGASWSPGTSSHLREPAWALARVQPESSSFLEEWEGVPNLTPVQGPSVGAEGSAGLSSGARESSLPRPSLPCPVHLPVHSQRLFYFPRIPSRVLTCSQACHSRVVFGAPPVCWGTCWVSEERGSDLRPRPSSSSGSIVFSPERPTVSLRKWPSPCPSSTLARPRLRGSHGAGTPRRGIRGWDSEAGACSGCGLTFPPPQDP